MKLHPRLCILCSLLCQCQERACGVEASLDPPLRVEFLNVGQGNASLLRWQGHKMLVDCGPDSAGILDTLRARGTDSLEWVLLSHNHRDHLGGLWELACQIKIGHIWFSTDRGNFWALDSVRTLAKRCKIPMDSLQRGDPLPGLSPWKARVLWPLPGHRLEGNAASTVLWVGSPEAGILWMADLGMAEEEALLRMEPTLSATVLQVGHHGSATSSGLEFLGRLAPLAAIISVGPNTYGHPRKEALERLQLVLEDSSRLFRTDKEGTVALDLIPGFGLVEQFSSHLAQREPEHGQGCQRQ